MLSLQGSIEEHPFPRLLNFLHESGQTGRLVLKHSGVIKTVYMVEGLAVNVESTLRDETLGRYLLKKGRINEDDYNNTIEMMMSQGIKQGAALVKIGALAPKELFKAVKDQTMEKLLSCFSWIKGEYRYQDEISFVEDINRFEMPMIPIMREGLDRFFPEDVLERELSLVPEDPLEPEPDLLEQISVWKLNSEEKALVFKVDGKKSLGELIRSAGGKEKRLFYLLLLIGMIKPGGRAVDKLREVIPGETQEPLSSDEVFMPKTITLTDDEDVEVEIEAAEAAKGEDDILSEYIDLKSQDYFALLGVERDAGDEDIEEAYRQKMDEFSRDSFPARLSSEAEAKLEEINARYILAYESIKNPERRDKYRQSLEDLPKAPAVAGLEAEKYLQLGMQSVRTRDWPKAQEMFEKAVELKPDEPEYYGYLGWSVYCNEELEFNERRDLAIEKLGMALEMNPNMDSVHVFLGKIFKDEGNVNEAVAEFKLALQCNPNCREAARELKAHGVDV